MNKPNKPKTSKVLPDEILDDLKAKACNDSGTSEYIKKVAKLLCTTAKDGSIVSNWFGKTERLFKKRQTWGATRETRNVVGRCLGFSDWNSLIKGKYSNYSDLLDEIPIENRTIKQDPIEIIEEIKLLNDQVGKLYSILQSILVDNITPNKNTVNNQNIEKDISRKREVEYQETEEDSITISVNNQNIEKDISGKWEAIYQETEEDLITISVVTEIIEFKQTGNIIMGKGLTIENNPENSPRSFTHIGKIYFDLYYGEFIPDNGRQGGITARGNCLLRINEGCDKMEGYCLWYDRDEKKVVYSPYKFKLLS